VPTYQFRNKVTGEVWEEFLNKISDMEEKLAANPDLTTIPYAVPMGDPIKLGVQRIHNKTQWNDRLRHIAKNHPLGKINIYE
jgi:hypothetical protein